MVPSSFIIVASVVGIGHMRKVRKFHFFLFCNHTFAAVLTVRYLWVALTNSSIRRLWVDLEAVIGTFGGKNAHSSTLHFFEICC